MHEFLFLNGIFTFDESFCPKPVFPTGAGSAQTCRIYTQIQHYSKMALLKAGRKIKRAQICWEKKISKGVYYYFFLSGIFIISPCGSAFCAEPHIWVCAPAGLRCTGRC